MYAEKGDSRFSNSLDWALLAEASHSFRSAQGLTLNLTDRPIFEIAHVR